MKKVVYSIAGIVTLILAGVFIYRALDSSLVYYVLPSEYAAASQEYEGRRLRLGGIVEPGSVAFDNQNLLLAFNVTDSLQTYPVSHRGAPPDLFKENTGVVIEGHFEEGVFKSNEVLVKHSEVYEPPKDGQPIDLEELKDTLQ